MLIVRTTSESGARQPARRRGSARLANKNLPARHFGGSVLTTAGHSDPEEKEYRPERL